MNVKAVFASTPVLERLRAETRPQHHAIETALELTSDTLTLGTYRQTLARFHGLYRPLEVGVQSVGGWADRGLDLAGRWKPPLLEADLGALGVDDPAALPVCTDLPPHATVAAVFGCLYVLEGATLGGQVISRALEKSLGTTPQAGDRTGKMWQAFRAALTAFAVAPCEQDEIVSAAKDTFFEIASLD
jgi:heme oxygenase